MTKISLDGRKDGRTEVKQYTPLPPVERGYNNISFEGFDILDLL